MNERMRRVLMALTGATAVAAASALLAIRVGRPLYYSDGEVGHLGAGERLRQAPMLLWSRAEPEVELTGPVRGRVAELPDGTFVYGLARGDDRTELVRYDRRRGEAEPIAALRSEGHDLAPSLSPDGGTLYFASDRPHENGGGFDVWCATVREGQVFAPRPLPPDINTPADESDPAVDPQTGAIVFVRRADALDARGTLSLWVAPRDGGAPALLLPETAEPLSCLDREPAFSPDGRTLWFVRQCGLAPPVLMRAWRHAGAFAEPLQALLGSRAVAWRAPLVADDGRTLRVLDQDGGLLLRARAVEVHPWWDGQAWLERLLLAALVLAALLWLLLALGRRWRALDVVTWCLIASILLHALILLWLRGVEIVRHYRNPAPRLGEIEVTLVASGGSPRADEAAAGLELAHELQFSGHREALAAAPPTATVGAEPLEPRAAVAAEAMPSPQAQALASEPLALADAAAAAALREARAHAQALAAAPSEAVAATPSPAAAAARRAAERADQAFVVQVPAAGGGLANEASERSAHAGERAPAAAVPQATPTPVPSPSLADAAAAAEGSRGRAEAAATATRELAAAAPAAPQADAATAERRQEEGAEVATRAEVSEPSSALAVAPAPRAASETHPALPPTAASPELAQARAVLQDVPLRAEAAEGMRAARAEASPTPSLAAGTAAAGAESTEPDVQRAAPGAEHASGVQAPTSMLAVGAPPAAAAAQRPSPAHEARGDWTAPAPRLADPEAAVAVAGPAAGVSSAQVPATAALRGEALRPAPAEPSAQRADAAREGPSGEATVHAPRGLLAAAPALAPTGERPAAEAAGRSAAHAARVALREALDAPAGAPPAPAGAAAAARPATEQGELPALARGDAALAPTRRGPAEPAPPGTGPEATVLGPSGLLAAASPEALPAGRSVPAPAMRAVRAGRVALRDADSGAAAAAPVVADRGSTARATPQPTSPARALPSLAQPMAAVVLGPKRREAADGSAERAQGIRPPDSLLPLPGPLRARPSAARVAALPDLYRSRFGPEKVRALEAFGGSEETEAAVRRGLEYLASIQRDDGAWGRRRRPHDKYGEVWVGKSALCLLAFLGAGHTQRGGTVHEGTVRRALDWLLAQQDPRTGHFGESSAYSHGITTYALAECFALTKDEALREPVERAVAWILHNQNTGRDRRSNGGWGYFSPTLRPEDRYARASVTAWMVMALKSAQLSGVEVPPNALANAQAFLWYMFDPDEGYFLYNREPGRLRSEWRTLPGSTPASVFCLLLLGAERGDQRLRAAEEWILERAPTGYRRYSLDEFVLRAGGNVYFWYYGSLACFLSGGEVWSTWNDALKRVLLDGQSEDGSFAPIDEYATYAGDDERDRAFTTAMCVLSLEVYYRYFTPLLVQPK